jgi:hypothetical protein
MGPRACLDGCGKSCFPPVFDPQTVQPIVSCYTDCYPGPHICVQMCFMVMYCIHVIEVCSLYGCYL